MNSDNFKLSTFKIARVSTVPFFVVTQLSQQLDELKKNGYKVTVIASEDEMADEVKSWEGIEFIPLEINRGFSIWKDITSTFRLWRIFKNERFNIVHSTTPKAGFLCALAGFGAGVPVRLHTFTGQPWVTMSGVKKTIIKGCDRLIGALSTACYADSNTQKKFLIEESIIKERKISVLGNGSLAGVDLARFNKNLFSKERDTELKGILGIPKNSEIILFVGRITEDKGARELIEAFCKLVTSDIDVYLLLVGPEETDFEELLPRDVNDKIRTRIIKTGYVKAPEKYMSISDILCLPSYREGFGTVVIEAASMGLPTVATNIYGLSDAVIDGKTGLLVPERDASSLFEAMHLLITSPNLKLEMSINAKERAEKKFSSKLINALLIHEYERQMKFYIEERK